MKFEITGQPNLDQEKTLKVSLKYDDDGDVELLVNGVNIATLLMDGDDFELGVSRKLCDLQPRHGSFCECDYMFEIDLDKE